MMKKGYYDSLPDETNEKDNGRDNASPVAYKSILPGDGRTISANNFDPCYQLPRSLPPPYPENDYIGNLNKPAYEGEGNNKYRRWNYESNKSKDSVIDNGHD